MSLSLLLFLLMSSGSAFADPAKEVLLDPKAVEGALWELPEREAASRLGAADVISKPGSSDAWYLAFAVSKLSGLTEKDSRRLMINSAAWLISSKEKAFAYMVQADSSDQEFYENWAEDRFQGKKIVHLEASPPKDAFDLPRFIHCLVYENARSKFAIITATPKMKTLIRRNPETGLETRMEILHKKDDSAVPLYLLFWDRQS